MLAWSLTHATLIEGTPDAFIFDGYENSDKMDVFRHTEGSGNLSSRKQSPSRKVSFYLIYVIKCFHRRHGL